jgi:hypothetical protein
VNGLVLTCFANSAMAAGSRKLPSVCAATGEAGHPGVGSSTRIGTPSCAYNDGNTVIDTISFLSKGCGRMQWGAELQHQPRVLTNMHEASANRVAAKIEKRSSHRCYREHLAQLPAAQDAQRGHVRGLAGVAVGCGAAAAATAITQCCWLPLHPLGSPAVGFVAMV